VPGRDAGNPSPKRKRGAPPRSRSASEGHPQDPEAQARVWGTRAERSPDPRLRFGFGLWPSLALRALIVRHVPVATRITHTPREPGTAPRCQQAAKVSAAGAAETAVRAVRPYRSGLRHSESRRSICLHGESHNTCRREHLSCWLWRGYVHPQTAAGSGQRHARSSRVTPMRLTGPITQVTSWSR